MMNQMAKLIELVNDLKAGTVTPKELAEKVKASLPPGILAMAKTETPESIIAKLEPLATTFMGKDVADLLKAEATVKLLGQALDIVKAE
jgi:hypothetical protein